MCMLVPIAGDAVAGPYEDALAAWRRGDYATAYRLWGPIADQGAPDAQFYLGFMNEYGQGVPRNSVEAIKWYRKAADQHHAVAQFSLGIMYASGEGVPHSDSEAAQWYRLAGRPGSRWRAVQPWNSVYRRQGRAAGPGAGAHVAGPRRLRTSAFGERAAEYNRRRSPSCRIQNEPGAAR